MQTRLKTCSTTLKTCLTRLKLAYLRNARLTLPERRNLNCGNHLRCFCSPETRGIKLRRHRGAGFDGSTQVAAAVADAART